MFMGGFGTFALGVGAALAARAAGPALGRMVRPVARGALKQGIILARGAQVRGAQMREDLEDLIAEAREDVRRDAEAKPQPGTQVDPQAAAPRTASA